MWPILAGGVAALLAAVHQAAAASNQTLQNPIAHASDLGGLLRLVLSAVIALAFPVIVLFIVYAGFRYLAATAQGQPEKVKEVNKTLLWAVVGALLILGGWALVKAIEATVCAVAPTAFGCSQALSSPYSNYP